MPTDAEALLRLERGTPECAHWSHTEYERILAGSDTDAVRRWVSVAEDDGRLMGFIVVKVLESCGERTAEIENIAVDETERRQGVGGDLCKTALAELADAGVVVVELEVREGNRAAAELYGRVGFRMVGRRKGYYAEPQEDAVLMRLDLRVV